MFKNMKFFTKNILMSLTGIVLVGLLLISINYFIQGNLLKEQLRDQTREISESWYKKIDGEEIEKLSTNKDLNSKMHKKYTDMFNKMSEYNPIVAQGYVYGTELSGAKKNETSLISFDDTIWEMFLGEGLEVGSMYEQPDLVVKGVSAMKETREPQFTEIYEDDYGTWLTFMYPIFNDDKKLIAYYAIDVDASSVGEGQAGLLKWSSVLLTVLLLVVMSFQYITLRKQLKPLTYLLEGIDKTSKGDFNSVLPEGNDELGNVNRKFNEMISSLGNMLDGVQSTSKDVMKHSDKLDSSINENNEYSEEINASINTMKSNLSLQKTSINEAFCSMEVVSEQIHNIANNANEVYKYSEEVLSHSETGKDLTEKVVSQMEHINKDVELSNKSINDLVKLSDDIGTILEVINNISSSTNLLALNASIEAARAGDAGKGFAIVAQEVKKLSEQSSKSTDDIRELINRVREAVNLTEEYMIRIKKEVISGKTLTVETNETFNNIYQHNVAITTKLQDISASSEEISASTEQSTAMIGTISSNAEENLSGYEEIVNSVKNQKTTFDDLSNMSLNLKESSQQLNNLVNKFKN